jgi:hypothetical protein
VYLNQLLQVLNQCVNNLMVLHHVLLQFSNKNSIFIIKIRNLIFLLRNLSSNIDRLTRDIESTRETTEKLRVLNPIGTEDDSSFTSMLTNAQV